MKDICEMTVILDGEGGNGAILSKPLTKEVLKINMQTSSAAYSDSFPKGEAYVRITLKLI